MSTPRTPPHGRQLRSDSTSSISNVETTSAIRNPTHEHPTFETLGGIESFNDINDVFSKEKLTVKDLAVIMRSMYEMLKTLMTVNKSHDDSDLTKIKNNLEHVNLELAKQRENLNKYEDNIEYFERQQRSSNLVITGIPVSTSAKDEGSILMLAKALGCELFKNDFTISRLFKTQPDRQLNETSPQSKTSIYKTPILIKFFDSRVRNSFFSAYLKQIKLANLLDTGIGQCRSRIYINEHLSKRQTDIFFYARTYKFKNKTVFRNVTTRNCIVSIRLANADRYIKIFSMAKLHQLCQTTSVAESASSDHTLEDPPIDESLL